MIESLGRELNQACKFVVVSLDEAGFVTSTEQSWAMEPGGEYVVKARAEKSR